MICTSEGQRDPDTMCQNDPHLQGIEGEGGLGVRGGLGGGEG